MFLSVSASDIRFYFAGLKFIAESKKLFLDISTTPGRCAVGAEVEEYS